MQHTTITQFDQVLEYFRQMDLVLLDLVLDEGRTYQGMSRQRFLHLLGQVFRAFRDTGNTQLLAYSGSCCGKSCSAQQPNMVGYCFVGDSSPYYLNMVFQVYNGQVLDMFECSNMLHPQAVPGREVQLGIDPDS